MNSAPPLVIGLFIAFACLVAAGRWALVNDTPANGLINRALTWDIGAVSGYVVAAAAGFPAFGQWVFSAVGLLALSYMVGFAALLGGADPDTVQGRQRTYNTIAVVVGLVELGLALADELGLNLNRFLDWEGVLWTISQVFVCWLGLMLMRACVHELRTAASTVQEKLMYSAVFTAGFYALAGGAWSALRTAAGTPPGAPGTAWAVAAITAAGTLFGMVALPVVGVLIARAEWDQAGRRCRRLRPLWRDLTDAVPEVVLPGEQPFRQGADSQLYRMTVEIRDALLHLKQFAPADATSTDTVEAYALRIAEAVALKQRGVPTRPPHSRNTIQPPVANRTMELHSLLALARAWPPARATVESAATPQQPSVALAERPRSGVL